MSPGYGSVSRGTHVTLLFLWSSAMHSRQAEGCISEGLWLWFPLPKFHTCLEAQCEPSKDPWTMAGSSQMSLLEVSPSLILSLVIEDALLISLVPAVLSINGYALKFICIICPRQAPPSLAGWDAGWPIRTWNEARGHITAHFHVIELCEAPNEARDWSPSCLPVFLLESCMKYSLIASDSGGWHSHSLGGLEAAFLPCS